jgi:DNA-binding SARP family transcriptional activator
MLALYCAGRQAEALETYRQARRNLDEQLAIKPGPALRELEAFVGRGYRRARDDSTQPLVPLAGMK